MKYEEARAAYEQALAAYRETASDDYRRRLASEDPDDRRRCYELERLDARLWLAWRRLVACMTVTVLPPYYPDNN